MKQYMTELKAHYKGSRWVGPIIEAETLDDAVELMASSPYRVIGELAAQYLKPDGDILTFIQHGDGPKVIH